MDGPDSLPSPAVPGEGEARRPRSARVLDDREQAGFLAEWETVQVRFADDPWATADAARDLVREVASKVISRVEEIREAVAPAAVAAEAHEGAVTADTPSTDTVPIHAVPTHAAGTGPEADMQEAQAVLMNCREAFFLLARS